jgi:hypothetical protein
MLSNIYSYITLCISIVTPFVVPEWTTEVTPVNSKENTTACATCNLIVESVFTALELGLTDVQIMVAIIVRCTTMRNYSIEVCKGAAKILLVDSKSNNNSALHLT